MKATQCDIACFSKVGQISSLHSKPLSNHSKRVPKSLKSGFWPFPWGPQDPRPDLALIVLVCFIHFDLFLGNLVGTLRGHVSDIFRKQRIFDTICHMYFFCVLAPTPDSIYFLFIFEVVIKKTAFIYSLFARGSSASS